MRRKIIFTLLTVMTINVMAQKKIVQTAGRTQLGEFAPEFAHLNDDILFGEVWTEASNTDDAKARFQQEMIFPIGEPNTAYAQYFTGDSHLAPIAPKNLSADEKTIQGYSNVTFEPGCRNNWHIHHGAHQILICVSGKGWYQEWGKPAIPLKAGDIIDIPEGVKHWHGAQADSWFQHLATHAKTSGEERNEWLEPVSDEEYNKLK